MQNKKEHTFNLHEEKSNLKFIHFSIQNEDEMATTEKNLLYSVTCRISNNHSLS